VKSETLPACGVGYVVACEGIHLWVRFMGGIVTHSGNDAFYVRRDSVEVLSYAD
jgi:hypothetical protein